MNRKVITLVLSTICLNMLSGCPVPYILDNSQIDSSSSSYSNTNLNASRSPTPLTTKQGYAEYSCDKEGQIKSGSGKSINLSFNNFTETNIQVYWLDFNGKRVLYNKALFPNKTHTQQTFITHPWLFADEQGDCLKIYVPSDESKDLDIVINNNTTENNPKSYYDPNYNQSLNGANSNYNQPTNYPSPNYSSLPSYATSTPYPIPSSPTVVIDSPGQTDENLHGAAPEVAGVTSSFIVDNLNQIDAQVSFNLFITGYADALIEIYDNNNNFTGDFEIIEGHRPPTDFISIFFSQKGIFNKVIKGWTDEYSWTDLRNGNGLFRKEFIKINVPKNGKMIISKNSENAILLNWISIGIDVLLQSGPSLSIDKKVIFRQRSAFINELKNQGIDISKGFKYFSDDILNPDFLIKITDSLFKVAFSTSLAGDLRFNVTKNLQKLNFYLALQEGVSSKLDILGRGMDLQRNINAKGSSNDTLLTYTNNNSVNSPYFDNNVSLYENLSLSTIANFSGKAKDINGLSKITMEVYGPKCDCGQVFTREISGKEYDLNVFYFNASEYYAGVKGEYTVSLWIKNITGQTANKVFKVYIK